MKISDTLLAIVLIRYSIRIIAHQIPILILHIGPHKTGSSHIQSILVKVASELSEFKFYAPHFSNSTTGHHDTKEFSTLASYFGDKLLEESSIQLDKLNELIHEHAKLKHNLIISAEAFSAIGKDGIHRLHTFLTKYYEVKVVSFYRIWVAQVVSGYYEIIKKGISFNSPYSDSSLFLSLGFDHLVNRQKGVGYVQTYSHPDRFLTVLNDYATEFGRENVIIIDYYGSVATGKDIAYIFFCYVLKIMCDEKYNIQFSTSRENVMQDLTTYQIAQLVIEIALSYDCNYSDQKHNHYLVNHKWPIPPIIIKSNLSLFAEISLRNDEFLRNKYHDIILFGNRTANELATQDVKYSEIDRLATLADKAWKELIINEIHHMKQLGYC
eukprot:gene4905-6868_t